jgi:hypothetical protein
MDFATQVWAIAGVSALSPLLWLPLSICEHHFGDLRTASVADHMLISATAFFTFTDSHKSVYSQRVLLTHFSCCASSAQPAVKIFFQFRHSAFDLNILKTVSLPEKSTDCANNAVKSVWICFPMKYLSRHFL